jgi:glucosyl-3-phosphoglycerate synthase
VVIKLQDKKLVDEIIVIDSGSKDNTHEVAKKAGADFYYSKDVLKRHKEIKGKGENLWKSLFVATGDIICWVDADIKNIQPTL